MRRHVTLLLTLLYAILFNAKGQWQWLNPQPSGYAVTKVVFTDMNNGFLLNSNGDLITTTDQGEHWTIKENFPATLAMDIKDGTGAIAGYSGILYISPDQGVSWYRRNIGTTDQFSMVDIVSKDTIFLATPAGKICRSDDGGNVWKTFDTGIRISSIEFINSKTGYVGGSSKDILKTEDGGATWQKNVTVNTIPSNTLSIRFLNLMTGYAFREHSTLLKTVDGGKNWTKSEIIDNIFSICPISDSIAFLVGDYGVVYRTNNGGSTWVPKGFNARYADYAYKSAWFFNESNGIAVGSRGRIMKTKDGGETWSANSPVYIDVRDIAVPASKTAYAVAGADVYKSTDKGQSWQTLNFPALISKTDAPLYFTHFMSADTGFVASNENTPYLYKTYDGGKTWKQITVLNFVDLIIEGMHFINKYTGYLTIKDRFNSSFIMKTTDGGESWSQVWRAKYFGERFNKIFFINETTGYGIRDNRLFRSDDRGASWTEQFTGGSSFNVTCVEFINATTGFVGESSGTLRSTTDNGKTWKQINIPSQVNEVIIAIKFINQKVGYLTGDAGGIYKSVDGGATWSANGRTGSNHIQTIKVAPDSTVYLAGTNGSILRQAGPSFSFYSFTSGTTNTCNVDFYSIMNVSELADSAFYEYGVNEFDQSLPAKLTNINATQQSMAATIGKLPPSTLLKIRLKVFFRGEVYYTSHSNHKSSDRPATPSILVSGPTMLCSGQQVLLSSSYTFANQWILNGVAIPGADSVSYTASTAGKYQLIARSLCYNSDTASILIANKPQPQKPVIFPSGIVLRSSANTGNQWFLNGAPIPGETNNTHTAQVNGKYNVQVKEDGCSSRLSDTLDYTITGRVLVTYPNPVRNILTIRNSMGEKMAIILTDVAGNVILKEQSQAPVHFVDLRHLMRGNYFLKVTLAESKKVFARTVVKQ